MGAAIGEAGTGVDGGVGVRVATAAITAAVGRGVGVGVGDESENGALHGRGVVRSVDGGTADTGATGDGAEGIAEGECGNGAEGADEIAAELSGGVANADCTTPADALVTITGNVPPEIAMTPPHTEQRARTPLAGTFAGSTRNTERQSGHATVIVYHSA